MKILGIETSCDETAASVIEAGERGIKVLSNIVSSQVEIHKKYGGVIPEVAARQHILNILPVINKALEEAGLNRNTAPKELKAVAVANGPGLITSLIVGVESAKSLSFAWNLPLIPINHIEGHIYSNFIEHADQIRFPALVLTVSGGHTMLVLMKGHQNYQIIGDTRDDAAGEAFDKAAQILDLGYPGGPEVARRAGEFKKQGSSTDIVFPRPMLKSNDFNFSFSGLKTSLLYKVEKDKDWQSKVSAYSFSFQEAIIDVLTQKAIRAGKEFGIKTLMLSGGVSANSELVDHLRKEVKESLEGVEFFHPERAYTTDNAAMIAAAAYYRARAGKFQNPGDVSVHCNAEL